MANITTWSYSRYVCYTECPLKAKFKFIDKLPEPGSAAMDRGTAIHKLAEDYVTLPKVRKLPQELGFFGEEFRLARKSKPEAEKEWGFTNTWEPTGWMSSDVWCRVKTDLVFHPKGGPLVVVDHKTGKRRDEHLNQLSLYALSAFIMYPEAEDIQTQVWYLDHGKPNLSADYTRKDVPTLKLKWENATRPMLNDTLFAPKPNYGCRWCHFRKNNGGPCEF